MKYLLALFIISGCCDVSDQSVVSVKVETARVSGFFIEPDRIMTVAHLSGDINKGVAVKYIDTNGDEQKIKARPVYVDKSQDVMVLDVDLDGPPIHWCKRDSYTGAMVNLLTWRDGPYLEDGTLLFHWSNIYITAIDSEFGDSGAPIVRGDCALSMHRGRTSIGTSYSERPTWEERETSE